VRPVEVSTEVRLPPEQVWDFMWADGGPPRFLADMHRLGYWRDVTGLDDYDLPAGGMPKYRMSRRFGPLPPVRMRTEYTEFERPSRAVNHALDTPLKGDFVVTNEPVPAGTRITWRWDVRAESPLLDALLRPLHPFLVRALRKNLDEYARAATTSHRSDRP
jgi:hypothetical protein